MNNHAQEQYNKAQAKAQIGQPIPERALINPFDGEVSPLDMVVIVLFACMALYAIAGIIKDWPNIVAKVKKDESK